MERYKEVFERRWRIINCIGTSHSLAKELLSKPDCFLTATDESGREYIIRSIKRKSTHANLDDMIVYYTLVLEEQNGNIRR